MDSRANGRMGTETRDNTEELTGKKKKRRLWVVTELYYPEETSTGYYLTRIAEGLAGDFDVRVLCGQPNYSARGLRAPTQEEHRGVRIQRVFGTRLNKNVIPYKVVNMITLSLSVFFRSLLEFRRGDRVLVVTTPPLLPFVTGVAARLKGAKHILLIHDNYPEILFAVGKSRPGSLFSKVLGFLNRKLLEDAHRIIVVGRDMSGLVLRKLGKKSDERVRVIPNWAELETVGPAPRDSNVLLRELGLEKKLVFLYAGNMGFPNDLESFLKVSEILPEDDPIHFVFLGAGVKRPLLETTVKSKGLKNITILDPKPRSEQKIFLNACDVGVVSLIGRMKGVSMPSRTYNILAAGKPILALCEEGSEIDLVVREEEVGWCVAPEDPDRLLRTIREIFEKRKELGEMGARARRAALEKYKLEDALRKYREVIGE